MVYALCSTPVFEGASAVGSTLESTVLFDGGPAALPRVGESILWQAHENQPTVITNWTHLPSLFLSKPKNPQVHVSLALCSRVVIGNGGLPVIDTCTIPVSSECLVQVSAHPCRQRASILIADERKEV